jgi:hypothetical protein
MRVLDKPLLFDVDADGDADVLLGKLGGALELHLNEGAGQFVRTETALGGITNSIFAQDLCLEIVDLNNNGQADLLTGTRSGALRLYYDFQQQGEAWTATDSLILNSLTGKRDLRLGRGVYPSMYGNRLIVGTSTGGLLSLKASTDIVSQREKWEVEERLQLYPNPAQSVLWLESAKQATVLLYHLTGKVATVQPVHVQPGEPASLPLPSELANGLYVVQIQFADGTMVHRKLIIRR